jgi:hypothetical protein
MKTIIEDIQIIIIRELNSFKYEIENFPDDKTVWQTVPGISNSAGNLALHICGNLKHYIGNVLGDINYNRNRDAEFRTKIGARTTLVNEINETINVVKKVMLNLSEDKIKSIYPESVAGVELPTVRFLIHLSVHLGFHLGQAGYLRRIITGKNQTSNPLSLKVIKK